MALTEVDRITNTFNYYKSARNKWELRGIEYEAVVANDVDGTGTQFNTAQLEEMRKKYMIPLSVNILNALVEQCQSFITGLKPSIGVTPVGDSSKEHTYIWREVIQAVIYLSKFQAEQEMAVRDGLTVGHGAFQLKTNDFYISNPFNVRVESIPWHWVYIDPTAKRPGFQDAQGIALAFPIVESRARNLYELTDADVNSSSTVSTIGNPTLMKDVQIGQTEKVLWLIEFYEKTKVPVYYLIDGSKTYAKPPPSSVDNNGNVINLVLKVEEEVIIKKTLLAGSKIVSVDYLPLSSYPFFFYSFTYARNPFENSMVHHVFDIQKALNKCLAITIENAQKSSNSGTYAPRGAIQNKSEFERQDSTPGGLIEYDSDSTLPDGGKPTQKMPLPLNNAWYTLFQSLIKLMEYITGIFDIMQGDPTNAPSTADATARLTNFGSQRPKMYVRHLDNTHEQIFDTLIEFYQAYAPMQNTLSYLDGTNAMVQIKTNIQASTNEQIQQYIEQAKAKGQEVDEQMLNSMVMSTVQYESQNKVVMAIGDTKIGKFKVRYQSISDLPTVRSQVLGFLQTLLSRMGSDAMSMAVVKMMLTLADYPETDKLLQDVNVIQQLQDQVQQLSTQLEQVTKEGKQLFEENINLKEENQHTEVEAELSKLKNKVDYAVKDIGDEQKEIEQSQTNIKEYS